MNWNEIASAALILFLIMDPFGNAPIFNTVLSNLEPRRRIVVMVREMLIALGILMTFLWIGNEVLAFLGISQPSLSIAGGVLLFIISLKMIFPESQASENLEVNDEPLIVPLATPLVAGPSALASLLLLGSNQPELIVSWSLSLFLAWFLSTSILVTSPYLLKVVGNKGSKALERLMGMILVILATQMLLNGIRSFISSFG